jgi:hypothetical protein
VRIGNHIESISFFTSTKCFLNGRPDSKSSPTNGRGMVKSQLHVVIPRQVFLTCDSFIGLLSLLDCFFFHLFACSAVHSSVLIYSVIHSFTDSCTGTSGHPFLSRTFFPAAGICHYFSPTGLVLCWMNIGDIATANTTFTVSLAANPDQTRPSYLHKYVLHFGHWRWNAINLDFVFWGSTNNFPSGDVVVIQCGLCVVQS